MKSCRLTRGVESDPMGCGEKLALNRSSVVYVCLSVWAYMAAAHIPEALDLSADKPDSFLRSL